MTYSHRRSQPAVQSAPIGGYRLDGSWDEHGDLMAPLATLVRSLIHDRRTSTVTPREIAARIPDPFLSAFPCLDSWRDFWYLARAATGAENAVVFCFPNRFGGFSCEPDEERSHATPAFVAIQQQSVRMVFQDVRPLRIAEFFGEHLDDADLTSHERQLVSAQMNDCAARDASWIPGVSLVAAGLETP